MSKRPHGRHAVYVAQIPNAWWPDSIVDLPERLNNVSLLDNGLTLCEAATLVQDHNRRAMEISMGIPLGPWAFLVFTPKATP